MGQRKIIHVDMDAFYAAVEQRDDPALRGRPVIVGGRPDSRGVVAACSYEARRFGIHSAMACARAYRLCPQARFVSPRFEVYRAVSRQIQAVFHRYTDLVEPLSLDEAYLDVSEASACRGSAILIARAIKGEIQETTGLTASAGVSYNKFLAKTASDLDKPDGLYVILPEQGPQFVARLPIGRFFGIGKVTAARMKALGIHTGADLRRCSAVELQRYFGKAAAYYYAIARGQDQRPVLGSRQCKSISAETTFARDLREPTAMLEQLRQLAQRVGASLRRRGLLAATVTIKVKYTDFQQVTRSHSPPGSLSDAEDLAEWLAPLLARTEAGRRPVRLLGVGVSGLHPGSPNPARQLDLI